MRATRQRAEVDVRHHGDPEPVERRIEPAQAHRHPQQVRRTERVGRADADQAHRRRTGGHGTGPGEEHPPVHRRRRRGLILGDRLGRGGRGRLQRLPLHPAPQREPYRLQHQQCQKQVHDQAEPEVARPCEPRRLGHPDDARQDQRRDQQRRERDEDGREDPRVRPGRVVSLTSRFQR